MKTISRIVLVLAAAMVVNLSARADVIGDWTETFFRVGTVGVTNVIVMTRNAALVHAAMFDTVNGLDPHFRPIRVDPAAAPRGASERAAVAQAAYAILVRLYPTQQATLDARLRVSLENIANQSPRDSNMAITLGTQWGQKVADDIWNWRTTDGFTTPYPPYLGGTGVGMWRPTPPANAPGFGLNFANMIPWVMSTASQFRPAAPPALTSARYTADFNEVKSMGSIASSTRTSDQTIAAFFWASTNAPYFWNRVGLSLLDGNGNDKEAKSEREDNGKKEKEKEDNDRSNRPIKSMVDEARFLAQLNLAMADAAIGCWEAKYIYSFWRPVTAIRLADTDGNGATVQDAAWTPLIVTPAHPEYPSGHSCISGAAGEVLAEQFGNNTRFTVDSDLMPGVTRSFRSFSTALEEVKNARIFGGIHFRSACDEGQVLGVAVANLVLDRSMQRLR